MSTSSPLTIVHTLAPATVGGLESVVQLLTTGLAARGHRVIVIASADDVDRHPLTSALRAGGVEVRSAGTSTRDYARERKMFAAYLRSLRPDVVHSHGYRSDILHLPVAREGGIGTVSTLHGFTGQTWKVRLYEVLQLRALRRASAVIAVSRGVYARARTQRIGAEQLHTIVNAYAPSTPFLSRDAARAELGIGPDEYRVTWIGRFSVEKGVDLMIDTMTSLRGADVGVSMIGDGPFKEPLSTRVRDTGLSDQVIFHGMIPAAARFLPAFDALVLSSRTEGTPMVVLEAMAAGVPVIAPRVGGIPDMLSDDEAMLVPAEDSDALANAIRDARHAPHEMQARAAAARTRLDRDFDVDRWLDQHEQLYRAISTRSA